MIAKLRNFRYFTVKVQHINFDLCIKSKIYKRCSLKIRLEYFLEQN